MYGSFSGNPGNIININCNIGSKIVFEFTKMSTWSIMAVAGALESKQEFVRNILKNTADKKL